jgi:hypothetical protein
VVIEGESEMSKIRRVHVKIEHPEWLDEAIASVMQSLRLIQAGSVPEVLKGRFLVTDCKRLLRCIYGSELDAIVALRTEALNDVAFWQEVDRMTPEEAKVFFADRLKEASQVSSGT